MPLITIGLICSLCLAPLTVAAEYVDLPLDQQVDVYIAQQMARYRIPGLALAVVQNGRVVKLQGYGRSSVELGRAVDENTVFQLYSVTKIWAGVAAMMLVEDGKISLDTPVTDIVEGLPQTWRAVHIRHILTHTCGIPEWSENLRAAQLSEAERKQLTTRQAIDLSAELPLKFQPGEKFSYNRSGFNLFALIVAKVTGKSFGAFLADRILTPLGMRSATFGDSEAIVPNRSSTYALDNGRLRNTTYHFGPEANPGAGLNASVADLARFLVALDNGEVLKPESLKTLWQPTILNDGTTKNYGLAWTIDTYKGKTVVGHEGGGAAWIAHFPAERLSIAVVCNLNGLRADDIQYGIADFYLK